MNAPKQMQPMMSDEQNERVVLGFLMEYPQYAEEWAARLKEECFYNKRYRHIYEAIEKQLNAGEPPDINHVDSCVRTHYPDDNISAYDLVMLTQECHTQDIEFAVIRLQQFHQRRQLQVLAAYLEAAAMDQLKFVGETVEYAYGVLDALEVANSQEFIRADAVTPKLVQRVNENQDEATRHHGAYTGLKEIDEEGGLPETGLTVVAGASSHGKSSFAAAICMNSAQSDMKSLYYSMELDDVSLGSRMVAMNGQGTTSRDIMYHRLRDDKWQQALDDIASFGQEYGDKIFYDVKRTTQLKDICSGIRQLVRTEGIKLAVVDFCQLLNYTMQDKRMQLTTEQLMGTAARTLKNLADRLHIGIVLVSQINRSLSQQRPRIDAIRDSGQIAEAADMVIFSWRPEHYGGTYDANLKEWDPHNTVAILVEKNREGATCDIIARFEPGKTLIRQLTADEAITAKQRQLTLGDAEGGW